ncbi:MAG: hypothetical protein ACOX6V_04215 [Patescibacteria group bacterium]
MFNIRCFLRAGLFLLAVIGFRIVPLIYAQQQVSDFQFQYEQYRQEVTQFEVARNDYLKHETLASKNEAAAKTQKFILQRAATFRTYFAALRQAVAENNGISESDKSSTDSKLNEQINWLKDYEDNINNLSNPSLEQLFNYSDIFEARESDYRLLGFETLAHVLIGKIVSLNQEYSLLLNDLEPYVQKSPAGYLTNWLKEARKSLSESEQHIEAAKEVLKDIHKGTVTQQRAERIFASVQTEVNASQEVLQKGMGYQKEIVRKLNETLSIEN